MRVGYCVEGSTDASLVRGLRDRWCPGVELIEGRFRGAFRRREIPHACLELRTKGVDLILLIRDANDENWRNVAKSDASACKPVDQHLVVIAVCDRNVECWLATDPLYAASITGTAADLFRVPDPKDVFEKAMSITALDRRDSEVVRYVRDAPLKNWLSNSSFEDFYEQLRIKSKQLGCVLENLRASSQP